MNFLGRYVRFIDVLGFFSIQNLRLQKYQLTIYIKIDS